MSKLEPLLTELVSTGGTTLHLAVGYPPLARVLGALTPLRDQLLEPNELEDALLGLLLPAQRARLAESLELDLTHALGSGARFRACVFMTAGGLGALFRLLPWRVPSLAELGQPEVVGRFAERRSGLVLVAGPIGSGKSTTLGALVDHVNQSRPCHILTIEDPIEHVHESRRAQVTQRQVGVHAPTFATAARGALRESADVVMFADLPDAETVQLAIQLAEQGALVLAGVGTASVVTTLDHLASRLSRSEQVPMRSRLADCLAGVVAQRLLGTAKGKVLVQEILIGSAAVSRMIREAKTAELVSVMQAGHAVGMQTLDRELERLVGQGQIIPEVALENAVDRLELAGIIAKVRPDLADRLA